MAMIIKLLLALFALLPLIPFGAWGASQYETLIKENPDAFIETIYAGVYVVSNANKEMEIILVGKNTPADKAGIKTGDIIVSVDNVKVKDRFTLFETIYERKKTGDFALVTLKRNGQLVDTTIQFSSTHNV
jgi:predicted metalloprotease with PDZ domain